MSQDPEQYPKTDVGDHQEEQIIRDFSMFNYHINSHKMRWLKDVIDVIDAHRVIDDFDDFDEDDDWDATLHNVATAGLTDLVNGVLIITTGQTENDGLELAKVAEAFMCEDCYPLYAEIRFKVSEAIQSDFWFGLVIDEGWFGTPDEAIIFNSIDGDASINFITRTGGAETLTDTTCDLTDLGWIRLGFHWDGEETIRWFVIQDGPAPQTILATGLHTTYIPTTELQLGFGFLTGDGAVESMYIDYVKCVQLRVIE